MAYENFKKKAYCEQVKECMRDMAECQMFVGYIESDAYNLNKVVDVNRSKP